MTQWGFVTNHGRVLLCITQDPDVRLRDIATRLGITERRAYDIVTDLIDTGYLVKTKEGRRNRYEVQAAEPLPDNTGEARSIGDVLVFLAGPGPYHPRRRASDRFTVQRHDGVTERRGEESMERRRA
jgi:winged helix-turn-helix DNA-binding protein